MGESMHDDDICEQIFIRLDVKDLIRCKRVCKSWESLISHPYFVKAYYKRQVNLRRSNFPTYLFKYGRQYYMVGSSNGLACISSFDGDEIIVVNPWTRQERIITPEVPHGSFWGFGYDSLTHDYKVVLGAMEGFEKIGFRVFSLKSKVWKHVGHVKYTCIGFGELQIGTLCNGALHWVMYSGNPLTTRLISFDLSQEVFREIDQPDDAIRECSFLSILNDYANSKERVSRECRFFNDYASKERVSKKEILKLYWKKIAGNYYALGLKSKERYYTFIPTMVTPSLISPYLQERN